MAQTPQQQVCELHFYEDDFEVTGTFYEQQLSTTVTVPILSQNKLKKDAVPSIFPDDPEYISKTNYLIHPDEEKAQEERDQFQRELQNSWKSDEPSNAGIHLEEVQVIQPLPAPQVQHLYLPQQHMVYSGHLSGSTTLQNVGPVPGVSLQIQPKASYDSKTYGVQNVQPLQRTFVLHKQPHHVPVHSNVQILNGANLNQVSQRQVISAQAPGHMYSPPQVLGSYALSPLPPGYSWASTSYAPQSPFIIRTPQPNIYVQHPSPHMAMHMPMPMHAAPSAIATQNYSEICQETQTITTETLIPSASQSIPCSSISSVVSSNAVTSTMPSNQQTNMYSLPGNHNTTHQYSQSFIPNQANQPLEAATQNPTNQTIESAGHSSANQPLDSVTQTSVIQVMNSDANNPINQSAESVSHNKMNISSESHIPNPYSETTNPNTAGQYIETPVYNQTRQSTESNICTQSDRYSESPNHSLSNKYTESQATQCSQQSQFLANSVNSKQSLNIHAETAMEVEESSEVFNQGFSKEHCADLLPQTTHHIEEQPVRETIASTNGNISTVAVPIVTSSPSSSTSFDTFRDQPIKSPLKTYSYTVVSPSSTTLSDNADESNGQSSGSGFYPIIKLKRLKPQDPLGKPDSADKHPQKAIVKPQMLAPVPDNSQLNARTGPFPESLKPSPSSPESLPLKKRKRYTIDDDDVPVIAPKYPEPIPPITDLLTPGHGHKRGRGRPPGRKSSTSKASVKSKTSATPKAHVKSKTPSPKRAITPVAPKKEIIDEPSLQETRRSNRRKSKIEVIEIVDDHDTVKMEIESPTKPWGVDTLTKTSYSSSNDNSSKDNGTITGASNNFSRNVKASISKENAFIETSFSDANWYDDVKLNLPSSSKANSFELENYDLKAITAMSVQEVCDYINGFSGCTDYGEVFKSQEIDGQALLLLNLDHLMTGFCMRLGPAVKLIAHINSLKGEEGE